MFRNFIVCALLALFSLSAEAAIERKCFPDSPDFQTGAECEINGLWQSGDFSNAVDTSDFGTATVTFVRQTGLRGVTWFSCPDKAVATYLNGLCTPGVSYSNTIGEQSLAEGIWRLRFNYSGSGSVALKTTPGSGGACASASGPELIVPTALWEVIGSDPAWQTYCTDFDGADFTGAESPGGGSPAFPEVWNPKDIGSPLIDACERTSDGFLNVSGGISNDTGTFCEADGPGSGWRGVAFSASLTDLVFAARFQMQFPLGTGSNSSGGFSSATSGLQYDTTDDRFEPGDGIFFQYRNGTLTVEVYAGSPGDPPVGSLALVAPATQVFTTVTFRAHYSATLADQYVDVYQDGAYVGRISDAAGVLSAGVEMAPFYLGAQITNAPGGPKVDAMCLARVRS